MEKDGSFSSFFMFLLASTSLIVILSEFFAGNFSLHSQASTAQFVTPPVLQQEYVEDEIFSEKMNGEEVEINLEEESTEKVKDLQFEIEDLDISPQL